MRAPGETLDPVRVELTMDTRMPLGADDDVWVSQTSGDTVDVLPPIARDAFFNTPRPAFGSLVAFGEFGGTFVTPDEPLSCRPSRWRSCAWERSTASRCNT